MRPEGIVRSNALLGELEAFDRFEISGHLTGWETARCAVDGKDTVPAAFEAVRSEMCLRGQIAGVLVEGDAPTASCVARHDELSANEKSVRSRSRLAKNLLMESIEREFSPIGIFAPRNEQAPSARVVGIGKESEPMEFSNTE